MLFRTKNEREHSSAGRAHALQAWGHRFKSCSRYYAQIAQLVEQRTENPRVAGSIPALGIYLVKCYKTKVTIEYGILAQLVEHLTFNQVVRGSNPRCLIRKYYRNDSAFFVLEKS